MNDFASSIFDLSRQVYGDEEESLLATAQAILETGWGRSAPGNNLFGIKGPGIVSPTWEVVDGRRVDTSASFRGYDSPEASIRDRGRFLQENPRYRKAGYFDASTAEEKAAALQRAGYATDPDYANKLTSIIGRLRGGDARPVMLQPPSDAPTPAEPETMTPFDALMNQLPGQQATTPFDALMNQLSGQQAPQVAQPNYWLTAAGNMDTMAPGMAGIAKGFAAAEKQRYESDLEQAKLTTLTPFQQLKAVGLAEDRRQKALERTQLQGVRAIAASKVSDPDVARLVLLGGMDDRLADLTGQGEATTAQKNYEYLVNELGMDTADAADRAFKAGGVNVNIGQGETSLGSVPSGHTRTFTEEGQAVDVPNPGTKEAEARKEKTAKLQRGIELSRKMIDYVQRYGTEATPFSDQKVRGEMEQTRSSLVPLIAVKNNMGVLQEGERKALEDSLADPASVGSYLTSNDRIIAQYETLMREFQDELEKTTGAAAVLPEGWKIRRK